MSKHVQSSSCIDTGQCASEGSSKKRPKKRSKTYTSCWTCRDRSVKCGEERPTCLRCAHSGIHCDGYAVGLVWPGDKGSKIRRRHMLEPALSRRRVLTASDVDTALAHIDMVPYSKSVKVDLFSVISPDPNNAKYQDNSVANEEDTNHESVFVGRYQPVGSASLLNSEYSGRRYSGDIPMRSASRRGSIDQWPFVSNVPIGIDPFYITSTHERILMYHWSSFLSGMMTPFPRPDNAFRDIITPLALTAVNFNRDSHGHLALLSAIYSVTAASNPPLNESEDYTNFDVARGHIADSVKHLSKALSTTNFEEQQAVLATILVLAIVPVFSGGPPYWRLHLRGAELWLDSIDLSAWSNSRSATIIYQILFAFSSFRPLQRSIARGLGPLDAGSKYAYNPAHATTQRRFPGGWYCDGIFGISETVIDIIDRINIWVYAEIEPTFEELEAVELLIAHSDPTRLHLNPPTKLCERLAYAHTAAFYFACQIFFRTALLRQSPDQLQDFVVLGIEQIEQISHLEVGLAVSGLMWPAFIIACETLSLSLQVRVMAYFDQRESIGLANVIEARKVVNEVWRRREGTDEGWNVFWPDVMADLDIDIMLS